MKKKWFLSLVLALICPLMGFSDENQQKKDSMIRDLDFIKNTFEFMYAPTNWKREHNGWDFNSEIANAKSRIQSLSVVKTKDYQQEVSKLLYSTKDYHVGVYFYSTESAYLPFTVKSADGHYIVTTVDRDRLSVSSYPIFPGDEVILFGDVPIAEAVAEIKKNNTRNANNERDQSLAEMFLTERVAVMGISVPKGSIKISVKSLSSGTVSSYNLVWNYTPEKIRSNAVSSLLNNDSKKKTIRDSLNKLMLAPVYETFAKVKTKSLSVNPHDFGERISFIPPLGKVLWKSEESNPFHAYLFQSATGEIIGYVRIPHYQMEGKDIEKFGEVIEYFEEVTESLVIDQVNNPGGSLFATYAMASMLTDKPLEPPMHRMSITQVDVMEATMYIPALENVESDEDAVGLLGPDFDGYPVNHQLALSFLDYYRFILKEWENGHYLTDSTFILGIGQIHPHPTCQYTKPILMLINGLDMSGGDFFPAILQDNNRITLLGSRTAGAGGIVRGFHYPNRFGIIFISLTCSIAERMNKNPIEDLGVTPDIPYVLSKKDLQYNYCDYTSAILDAVEQLK